MVLSGESGALAGVLDQCEADGVWARRIPVDYASHSPQIESIRDRVTEVLARITPRSAGIRFYSTVSGELMDTAGLDAGYWYRNVRDMVRFEQVIRTLVDQGYTTFIEISPHPVLTVAVEQTVEATGAELARVTITGSTRRDSAGLDGFLASLGHVHARGAAVDWSALFAGRLAGWSCRATHSSGSATGCPRAQAQPTSRPRN